VSAHIIDGSAIAAGIRDRLRGEVVEVTRLLGRPPGLGVILVGDDPASAIYVRMKGEDSREIGLHSVQVDLPATATQEEVEAAVQALNADPAIDAFLVQVPLPPQIDTDRVISAIDPDKDADGVHPYNAGLLSMGRPRVVACTPAGVMQCIETTGVELTGAEAVVVGRSNIVGRPVAALLTHANCTVTVCHSRSRDLGSITRRADVLVAAVGKAGMITGDMVKPGAVVIDVGVNRIPSPTPGGKDRLVGDVDRESVEPVAGFLTPSRGGVGPLTRANLLANTVAAARRRA
jgi:methylenetetrahydrofolate dehydrogenase (NADP+)/methenyltetrahydrofolate cyclohydrolase